MHYLSFSAWLISLSTVSSRSIRVVPHHMGPMQNWVWEVKKAFPFLMPE